MNDDGLVRAVLFVVPRVHGDKAALADHIQHTLTRRLSVYKCPRAIRFIDAMPRTATGKVQRFKLREMVQAPAYNP